MKLQVRAKSRAEDGTWPSWSPWVTLDYERYEKHVPAKFLQHGINEGVRVSVIHKEWKQQWRIAK